VVNIGELSQNWQMQEKARKIIADAKKGFKFANILVILHRFLPKIYCGKPYKSLAIYICLP